MVLDQKFVEIGSATRQKLIDATEDIFDTILAVARGITVEESRVTDDGEMGTVVYRVPPHWPALKYLADWQRKVLQTDPKDPQLHLHGLTDEMKEVVKAWMAPKSEESRPYEVDGVIHLGHEAPKEPPIEGDYTEIQEITDDDSDLD